MRRVGALTAANRAAARSGRPPRETTAAIRDSASAAAQRAAAAPVLAPKQPTGPATAASLRTHLVASRSLPEQGNVKHVGAVGLLVVGQQVEEKRAQAGVSQPVRHEAVASAAAAAATAMGEDHEPFPLLGSNPPTGKLHPARPDHDLRPPRTPAAEQQGHDLVIGCLREVFVELADRHQMGRGLQTHDLVRGVGELKHGRRRRDGRGQDHLAGAHGPRDLTRSTGGRAGGDAVVYDHCCPSGYGDGRATLAVAGGAPFELAPLGLLDRVDVLVGDPRDEHHLRVEDSDAPFADRPHPQLRLKRNAKLANKDDVEGCAEGAGDFERDRHPAPWQAENDHIRAPEPGQSCGQLATRVGAVDEWHQQPP